MFTGSIKTEGFNFATMTHPAVARRQLQMSIGALLVIALVAVGAAFSMRGGSATAPEQLAGATAAIVVKAAVRMVPSERLQATDQTRPDRRS